MKKRRIFLYIIGIITLLFILLSIGLYIKRDDIKNALISGANQKLKVPFQIEEVDISLSKFPSAALHFTNVYSPGSYAKETDTLLFAEDLYLQFSIWQIITGKYSIHSISVENGTINIKRSFTGKHNYLIFKTDTSSQGSVFTLNQVTGTGLKLSYFDDDIQVNSSGFAKQLSLSGSFEPNLIQLEVSANSYVDSVLFERNCYLKKVPLQADFTYTSNESSYQINQGSATLNNDLNFNFEIKNNGSQTQVFAQTKNTDLGDFKTLAENQKWYKNESFDIDGILEAQLNTTIAKNQQDISINFSTTQGTLKGIKNGAKLNKVSFTGSYKKDSRNDHLKLDKISAEGKTGILEGNLTINSFSRPLVSAQLNAQLSLDEWLLFLPSDTIENASGDVKVNVDFKNQFTSFNNLSPRDFKYARVSGNVEVANAAFAFKNSQTPITNLNGAFRFENNNLNIDRLFVKLGQSDLYLDGYFGNVLNVLLFKEEKLQVRSKVKSQQIVLEDFLTEDEDSEGESNYTLNNLRGHSFNLDIEIDKFKFKKVTATNISGKLSLNHGLIKAQNTKFKMTEGSVAGNLEIDIATDDFYYIDAKATSTGLNIKQLFYSFDNFGQEEVTGENLDGKADINIDLTASMSPTLYVDASSVKANTHIVLHNGALINYAPMLSLSRFASIDELKHIKFDRLENNLSIANSTLTVPNMQIKSNVLNLWLNGTHTFENNVDYTLKLKLDDVLFTRKKKSGNGEFDSYISEQQTLDDPYIYVKMAGPAADPQIGLDKKAINTSIKEDLKEEGQTFKDLFKKKKEKNSDEQPKMIFSWPEDSL